MKNRVAFTLMEIMVVIIIIGLLAGLSVANYYKSSEQALKKNAFAQLRMIHRGQEWYKVKNKVYYPQYGDGNVTSVADINAALDIYVILSSNMICGCFDTGNNATFQCRISRYGKDISPSIPSYYSFFVNEAPLSDTNPWCVAGMKPCP